MTKRFTQFHNVGLTVTVIGALGGATEHAAAQMVQDAGMSPQAGAIEAVGDDLAATHAEITRSTTSELRRDDGWLSKFKLDLSAGVGNLSAPGVNFMRLESGGMVMNRGFGVSDPSITATQLSAEASFELGPFGGDSIPDSVYFAVARLFLAVDYFSGENSRSTPLIPATVGYQLGINDGNGGGFLLAAGFSDLDNVSQRNEVYGHGYKLGLRWKFPMPVGDSLGEDAPELDGPGSAIDFSLRLNYRMTGQEQNFAAVTNGNTLAFTQRTKIEDDILGTGVDVGYSFDPPVGLPGFYTRVSASVGVNHHDADAKGELDLLGMTNFDISEKSTEVDWGAGLEFGIRNGNFDFGVRYRYNNFAIAEVNFPDAGSATLGTGRAKTHSLSAGITFGF